VVSEKRKAQTRTHKKTGDNTKKNHESIDLSEYGTGQGGVMVFFLSPFEIQPDFENEPPVFTMLRVSVKGGFDMTEIVFSFVVMADVMGRGFFITEQKILEIHEIFCCPYP
jgi:hypothetical protein